MPTININIKNKIAASPVETIVCDNSDYKIHFVFDDEWSAYDTKTARFAYGGKTQDVLFNGDTCDVPIITDVTHCAVGVYAGELRTTTPALITCRKSILYDSGVPADPLPDVYEQLIQKLDSKQGKLTAGAGIKISENNVISATGGGGIPTLEPLTFTGAVIGTYDGTEALTVNIPSGGGSTSGNESWTAMHLLASGTITTGTAANTKTDTGVKYSEFKKHHRLIFIRRSNASQGNFSNGFGYENNAGFRCTEKYLSVVFEHIDGYLWHYNYFSTDTAVYAQPTTDIRYGTTETLWSEALGGTSNCNVSEGYLDIRCQSQSHGFTDDNTFQIKNWQELTADVNWWIYSITEET